MRFLVVDLSLVAGVDLSSAEVFVRVQRLLAGRDVILVLCGFALDSDVGKALENVDLFREDDVEIFSYLNEALECAYSRIDLALQSDIFSGTENAYLKAWLSYQKKNENDSRDKAISVALHSLLCTT